jgi:twitching motility protein PilT
MALHDRRAIRHHAPMPLDLHQILDTAVKQQASDVHLKAGMPPILRVNGELRPLREAGRLTPEELTQVAASIMSGPMRERFKKQLDVDLAYGVPGVGRFRVNVFLQRGSIGLVFRVIPYKVPEITTLHLPDVVTRIAEERRGLVLVTGATGSGKSTTLAAMIEHINATRTSHIVTIEDPIEFLIRDRLSLVNQREVGSDSIGFHHAFRAALRQDPDVILVGEMRDLETIEIALTAAETGHLVMSTLHTMDATETVSRVVATFPPHQQSQARTQLASLLKAVVCQRLVPRADGQGRVPAVEVMLATARIRELILDPARVREIPDAIAEGRDAYGMQTFDQSLLALLRQKLITYEEAQLQATNRDDFALRVSGIEPTSKGGADWQRFDRPAAGRGGAPKGRRDDPDFEIERF